MEITLRIIQVLPTQEGVGKQGNPWKLQPYVGETIETYAKKVYFEVFGESLMERAHAEEGDLVNVSFDLESREFNGRWYTSVRAWKIVPAEAAAQPVQPKAAPAPTAPVIPGAEEASSELPFS